MQSNKRMGNMKKLEVRDTKRAAQLKALVKGLDFICNKSQILGLYISLGHFDPDLLLLVTRKSSLRV